MKAKRRWIFWGPPWPLASVSVSDTITSFSPSDFLKTIKIAPALPSVLTAVAAIRLASSVPSYATHCLFILKRSIEGVPEFADIGKP